MENFDHIVSLGYNCYPATYIEKKRGKNTHLFCDMAAPAWALVKMLEDDFSGFYNKQNYAPTKIFADSGIHFMTNKTYYARLAKGVLINDNFMKKITEKKNEFMSALNSSDRVLFIRYEEPTKSDLLHFTGARIIPDEYAAYYAEDEFFHLKALSTYLQQRHPQLQYNILFIGNALNNEKNLSYDALSKIFTIPNVAIASNYEKVLDDIFINNQSFINEHINQ